MTRTEIIAAAQAAFEACQTAHDTVEAALDPHPQVLEALAMATNIAFAELQEELSEGVGEAA